MRLLIVRHADPDHELDSLTPQGRSEATALAPVLVRAGVNQLFSSPLGRAQATAAPTVAATGLALTTLPWAAELQGLPRVVDPWGRDRPAWDNPGERVRAGAGDSGWWGGLDEAACVERLAEVAAGSDALLAGFGLLRTGGVYQLTDADRGPDPEPVVAVFCHLGLGLTWLAHLLCLPAPLVWCGFFLPPSSVTTVLFEQRSDAVVVPRVLGVGDCAHLDLAGLPRNLNGLSANTR